MIMNVVKSMFGVAYSLLESDLTHSTQLHTTCWRLLINDNTAIMCP